MSADPETENDVDQLVSAVAATGLEATHAFPADPLDDDTWSRFLARVGLARIPGLLVMGIESGALPVTESQYDDAAQLHEVSMTGCLRLEARLLEVLDRFDASSIDHRVLKGSAVAHLDYADPAQRAFGDVDLLVRPEQFDEAVAVLSAAGYERRFPQPRPGFDRRFTKSIALVGADGVEMDLHRTLAEGPFGLRIDLDELWRRPERYVLGSRDVLVLSRHHRLLHACYHASLGSSEPPLVTLRDIAQLVSALPPGPLEDSLASARRWKGEAVVARAVNAAWTTLAVPETDLSRWARARRSTRAETRELHAYTGASMGYPARALAAVRALPGLRLKVAYLVALGFPQHEYLEGRHGSRRRRWALAARQAARMRRSR